MKHFSLKIIYALLIIILIIGSCIKETYDIDKMNTSVDVNTKFGIPIANGSIKFENIIPSNDSLIKLFGDTIHLWYVIDTLFDFNTSDLFEFKDDYIGTGIDSVYKLGNLEVKDTIKYKKVVTLENLLNDYPLVKSSLETAKSSNANIPPFDIPDGGSYPDSSGEIKSVNIESGTMEVELENNMSFRINSLTLVITDHKTFNESFIYSNLNPGSKQKQTVDLANKTVTDEIFFEFKNISAPGGEPASQIDFEKNNITSRTNLINLKAKSGIAKITPPAPVVKSTIQKINIPNKSDIELHSLTLSSGNIAYKINNNTNLTIILNFQFPGSTTQTGSKLDKQVIILPRSNVDSYIDFTNANIDLTNNGTTHSTINVNYTISVDTTNKLIPFQNNDSVSYHVSFSNFKFKSVQGYFGQDTIQQDSSINIPLINNEIMNRFEGSMKFSDPKISLTYTNSIGVPIQLKINMSSKTKNGTTSLNKTENIKIPASPTSNPVTDAIIIDKTNNLDDILSFPPPDSIYYDFSAITNAAGKTTNNFISNTSKVNLGLKIDIPFKLNSSGFSFKDTFQLNIPPEVTNLDFAKLGFTFINDFPFNLRIKIIPFDSALNKAYSPITDTILLKASTTNDLGVTIEPSTYSTSIGVSPDDFDILKTCDHIILQATIDTKDKNNIPKDILILSTYKLKFSINIKTGINYKGDPQNLFK
jgi:hypothetical protein